MKMKIIIGVFFGIYFSNNLIAQDKSLVIFLHKDSSSTFCTPCVDTTFSSLLIINEYNGFVDTSLIDMNNLCEDWKPCPNKLYQYETNFDSNSFHKLDSLIFSINQSMFPNNPSIDRYYIDIVLLKDSQHINSRTILVSSIEVLYELKFLIDSSNRFNSSNTLFFIVSSSIIYGRFDYESWKDINNKK